MEKVETVLNQQKRGYATTRTLAVSATAALAVATSTERTAVILSVHAGTVFIGTNPGVADLTGVRLTAAHGPLRLTLAEHGAIVFGPLYAISPGGADTMGIVEVTNNAP